MCPKAKANMPAKIQNFFVLVVMYLNPKRTSPNNPKIKPKSKNSLNKKCPSPERQNATIATAIKNKDAIVLKMIVFKE